MLKPINRSIEPINELNLVDPRGLHLERLTRILNKGVIVRPTIRYRLKILCFLVCLSVDSAAMFILVFATQYFALNKLSGSRSLKSPPPWGFQPLIWYTARAGLVYKDSVKPPLKVLPELVEGRGFKPKIFGKAFSSGTMVTTGDQVLSCQAIHDCCCSPRKRLQDLQ